MKIIKNTQAAGYHGSMFGQDVEAVGTYVLEKTNDTQLIKGWVEGIADIKNPLIVNITDDTRISYKYELSQKYKAKGKALTKKLMNLGFDAIITVEEDKSTSEIVLFPNCNFMLDRMSESKILIKNLLREALNKL